MTILLSPATSDYLLEPAPDHLHQDATEWLSDLEFCKTELSFLNKLLDKTFLRSSATQMQNDLAALDNRVKFFRTVSLKKLHDEIINHERRLAVLDEDVFSMDRESIIKEHEKQEVAVNTFMETVKKLKKEIFAFVEQEIKSAT
jgi:hypothetical protein